MGVRGLIKRLKELSNGEPLHQPEVVPQNSTLLIDGCGFVFHLIEKATLSFHRMKVDRTLGGDYLGLDEIIRIELKRLQTLGFTIMVFMDGPTSHLKGDTTAKRRQQRLESSYKQYQLIHGASNIDLDDLPLPILALEQFMVTLKAANKGSRMKNIRVVECKYEVDQEMALYCATNNAKPKKQGRFYCCSADSDFIVMKDCPFVHFQSLLLAKTAESMSDIGEVVVETTLDVYRRSHVAAAVSLSEAQFVDFCILMGNDFTGEFDRHLFDNIDGSTNWPRQTSGDSFIATLQLIRSHCSSEEGSGVFVAHSSRSSELQLAIEYSRAFYELHSLSAFQTEANLTVVGKDLEEDEAAVFLNVFQKSQIKEYVQAQKALLLGCVKDSIPFAGIAVESLKDLKSGHSSSNFDMISAAQLDALEKTSNTLQDLAKTKGKYNSSVQVRQRIGELVNKESGGKTVKGHSTGVSAAAKGHKAEWANVIAANQFQLIVKYFAREVEKVAAVAGVKVDSVDLVVPSALFDGVLFHHYMRLHAESTKEPLDVGAYCKVTSGLVTVSEVISSSPPKPAAAVAAPPATKLPSAGSSVTASALRSIIPSAVIKRGAPPSSTSSSSAAAVPASAEKAKKQAKGTVVPPSPTTTASAASNELPIDKFRTEILQKIARDRVVIIHGETGCGKSSRIPAFIYEDAQQHRKKCRFMVSQPRRIAAKNLMNRLHDTLGEKVGMRMGHGVREEAQDTVIHFVTTGYLVRLLAHHPDVFKSHTHLIIDEVHERSVDSDLLCYLARRLLAENKNLRLILMSATIHTDLYREYFSPDVNGGEIFGDLECLSVGVKRFPLKVNYIEDMISDSAMKMLPSVVKKSCSVIMETCDRIARSRQLTAPSDSMIKAQYTLIVELIRAKVAVGTGVLIFVSGIAEITELQLKFEGIDMYRVIVIHGDIPFEEQQLAFVPAAPDEIKIVIATNAAESSITLPDVDTVICMGTHKTVQYDNTQREESNNRANRASLVKCWISKASATQRAGRTARTRPGTAYRLYSRSLFENCLVEHELAEVFRKPLHDVILNLMTIFTSQDGNDEDNLDEGEEDGYKNYNNSSKNRKKTSLVMNDGYVGPILNDLIEPPSVENVHKSFQHLYEASMISAPCDGSSLTMMGEFAGQMPVDLSLSRLIIYGISLGFGAEAVILAMALTQPAPVFRRATPLIHDCDEYVDIVKKTYLAQTHLDNGIYSEPIMMLKMFIMFHSLMNSSNSNKEGGGNYDAADNKLFHLCNKYGIVWTRMRQFMSASKNLLRNVNSLMSSHLEANKRGKINKRGQGHVKAAAPSVLDFNTMLSMAPNVSKNLDDINCGVPFNTELLTILRLILTWTSSENVLRMKESKKKVDNYAAITIKNDDYHLSKAQLDKLFVVNGKNAKVTGTNPINTDIQYRMVHKCNMIFEGYFNAARRSCDWFELLRSLFYNTSGKTIVEPDANPATPSRKEYFDKYGLKVVALVRENERQKTDSITLTILTSAFDPNNSQSPGMKLQIMEQQLMPWIQILYSVFGQQRLVYAGNEHYSQDGASVFQLHLFVMSHPSNKECATFKKFLSDCAPQYAIITVPENDTHTTKLSVVNFTPDENYVSNIYHKCVRREDSQLQPQQQQQLQRNANHPAVPAPSASEFDYSIRHQTYSTGNQTLHFVDPEYSVPEGTTAVPRLRPLFDDFPLGVRLFNAYTLGYRSRKLMLFRHDNRHSNGAGDDQFHRKNASSTGASATAGGGSSSAAAASAPTNSIVPGSLQWNKLKKGGEVKRNVAPPRSSGKKQSGRGGDKDSEDGEVHENNEGEEDDEEDEGIDLNEKVVVNHTATNMLPTWSINLLAEKLDEEGRIIELNPIQAAFVPKHTVIGTARLCNNSNLALYGVAYTSMALGSVANTVACDGVTLLPLGEKFVSMALWCISAELKDGVCKSSKKALSAVNRNACEEIRYFLNELKNSPVGVDVSFLELVSDTFRETNWYEG